MKTDTQLLNEIAQNTNLLRQLTEDESIKLKETLLEIHNYIISVCDKHHLTIMLGGGSCLGAVRHKGYIPWDDDLDFMMPRPDYEKLIKLWEKGEIDNKYHFEYPNKKKDVKNPYLKVFLLNTKYADIFDDDDAFPTSIFVDVFPMDYTPENNMVRKCKAIMSDALQFVCTCTLYAQYPNDNLKMFYSQDKDANKRFKLRLFIGHVFSVISHRRWVYWFDKFNNTKPTGMMTIPTGRKHYWNETLPTKTFVPVKECTFEGVKSYLANDYKKYLSNLYGDYMQVPPENKRERHFIVDIKF